ncbi:mechanosensitive ion channel family protein [Acuticoccus sp. M5D2P5]|uniref:mechanosensitive ion channel family protein n=1 Tax=Acuticoccus kalidii TaxID=2910977 RepID=UPI001F232637|nr:mechanosensitive ion channel family protein [Acuticoccus kalidii]MCF3932566.1 mechanosensitive ion channel family protein [Acuticoccus kalidii]
MKVVVLALIFSILSGGVMAQSIPGVPSKSGGSDGSSGLEQAVKTLEAAGNNVFIVPAAPTAATAPTMAPMDKMFQARMEFASLVRNIPHLPGDIANGFRTVGRGSITWLATTILYIALTLMVGAVAYLYMARLLNRVVGVIGTAPLDTRAGRVGYALSVLLRHLGGAAALLAAGTVTLAIVQPQPSPQRATIFTGLLAATLFLALRAVLLAVLAPREPHVRLAPFDDALAQALFRQLLGVLLIADFIGFFAISFSHLPLAQASRQTLILIPATVSVILLSVMVVIHRRAISRVILGRHPRPNGLRRFLSIVWPVLAILYLVLSLSNTVARLTIDGVYSAGPVVAPMVGLVAALVVAGLLILLHDQRLKTGIVHAAWTDLYERVAIGVSAIIGFLVLGAVWDVERTAWADKAETLLGVATVALIAWAAWQAVRLWVTIRLEDEADAGGHDGEGEGFGPGVSRLATLLPIFRNVMLFFIVSVFVMVVLSTMGVSVAPLFAGAGIVGLAIGFGSQTLIRDVFSGAFFLLDDAFRRGEYVQVAGIAGQVEKISVRSFQLRHHEGPLHTIPFGEIKQLTNFSRDWVIMKLPVRLTYDTDVELVRKLVKKLGQEMMADPELGHLFLEPPKSQGVVQMEDSAMIIRIKFKTKPGDQFLVRRHVYQRVREIFAENDIHFAHREVTVRVAGTDDEEVRRRAAMGAVIAAEQEDTAA